jgi:hypothetical protein
MNPIARMLFYRAVTSTYEVRPSMDETHIVTSFDYDNYARYVVEESIKLLNENNHTEASKLLQEFWFDDQI